MIIEHNIAAYLIDAAESVASALHKITENKSRFIICVSDDGGLEGGARRTETSVVGLRKSSNLDRNIRLARSAIVR